MGHYYTTDTGAKSHRRTLQAVKLTIVFSSIIAMATLYAVNSFVAYAATSDACFEFNSDTHTITDYYDNQNNDAGQPACPKNVDIPGMIGDVSVTAIDNNGFYGKGLTAVTLPNTITTINGGAFGSNSLTSIIIPDSVIDIGGAGFSSNQLETVVIGNGLTSIEGSNFGSNPIKHLTIGSADYNGLAKTPVNNGVFSYMGLETLSLGPVVASIDDHAFGYNNLTSVTIPSTLTTIAAGAFEYNQLVSISLPNTITTIGSQAFQHNQIASIIIPSSVTTIGANAFYDNDLATLTIPNSVTTMGHSAFADNPSLETVYIGNGLASVGDNNQFGGDGIRTLTIGTADYVGTPVTTVGGFQSYAGAIETLTLNPSVAAVDGNAFNGSNLKTITINGSPTIGSYAFAGNGVETVTINGNPTLSYNVFSENLHSIPDTITDPDDQARYYQDHASYVRVFASNPDFIATYGPGDIYTAGADCTSGYDENDQWFYTCETYYTIGGYVINPASYTVNYRSNGGTTLAPQFASGTGPTLADYSIAANPTGDFSLYYTGGNTIDLTAPDITGYTTPVAHALTLVGGINDYTFVYAAPDSAPSDPTVNSGANDSTLSNTGSNMILFASLGVVLLLGGTGLLLAKLP